GFIFFSCVLQARLTRCDKVNFLLSEGTVTSIFSTTKGKNRDALGDFSLSPSRERRKRSRKKRISCQGLEDRGVSCAKMLRTVPVKTVEALAGASR
ncbi:MAG TPA: hypothetical protein VF905_10060, partial [Nitrospirota bacterium]